MDKIYNVTQEIIDLFCEADVADDCKEKSISSIWGTKRAIQFGKQAKQKRDEAWALILELHPELTGKNMTYTRYNQRDGIEPRITIKENKNE